MVQMYEEPPGYSIAKGFVKSNPNNNDAYVAEWVDDPWYPAIKNCHVQISEAVPNYNIAQIKEKFGGLRFYYDLPLEEEIDWDNTPTWITDRNSLMEWCDIKVLYAEGWVDGYEHAIREGRQ